MNEQMNDCASNQINESLSCNIKNSICDETKCFVCPNKCGVDRDKHVGYCLVSNKVKLARVGLHFFEEPVISGTNGSGTIFFCGCSLRCVFCQNYPVSRNLIGREITVNELADIFKNLEEQKAHNINLVSPTHYAKQIVEALKIYKPKIPIVWNTHGYESLETLEFIEPYVDIYLTDLKYYSSQISMRYTNKSDYFDVTIKAIKKMVTQKETIIENGLMKQGVIVRHLILPENSSDSVNAIRELAKVLNNNAYLSLMAQYTPIKEAQNFNELKRKITHREYKKVLNCVYDLGLVNVFLQERTSSSENFIPIWDF